MKIELRIFLVLGYCLGHVYALGHINDDFRLVISGENGFESMAFLA